MTTPTHYPPEFFPIPPRGPDSYFGLGRSSYYDLERRGLLRLVRVRKPGNSRGKVLVPFAEAAALIRKLGDSAASQPLQKPAAP
jgi:hypothetical protein